MATNTATFSTIRPLPRPCCISAPNAYTVELIAPSRLPPSNHLSSTFRFTATIRYRLIAADTVEKRIRELHCEKRALAEDVPDGTGAAPLTPEELMGLFR